MLIVRAADRAAASTRARPVVMRPANTTTAMNPKNTTIRITSSAMAEPRSSGAPVDVGASFDDPFDRRVERDAHGHGEERHEALHLALDRDRHLLGRAVDLDPAEVEPADLVDELLDGGLAAAADPDGTRAASSPCWAAAVATDWP